MIMMVTAVMMVMAMKLQRDLSNCWVEVRLQRRLYQGKRGSEKTNYGDVLSLVLETDDVI